MNKPFEQVISEKITQWVAARYPEFPFCHVFVPKDQKAKITIRVPGPIAIKTMCGELGLNPERVEVRY